MKLDASEFIRIWGKSELKESSAAQSHFVDLCHLLDVKTPTEADAVGDTYCFEKGATKSTGGNGFADVWKKGCFGWEYKGPNANLDLAYAQLQRYAVALENPPLLIVCDTKSIVIRTNWTNTVSELHTVELIDLVHADKRELLRNCFVNPAALKPKRTRDDLTKEAADEFSALAQSLRARGHEPETVAHFVNRLVFCMFAEDVQLLPNKLFQKAMERSLKEPKRAQKYLTDLFAAMNEGGEFGLDDIPWFNGGLFDSSEALPLDRNDVELAVKAAKLDWSDIDPSILGTLFERGLDPSKRSQLGAHYTDPNKITMILNPVIIEPLEVEWADVKAKISEEMDKSNSAKTKGVKTKAHNRATKAHSDFIERLANFRVLDPACGSGNFLYLSLKALKDIEHKANVEAEALGLPRGFPRVGPEAVKGIELNPYAAELARVSIWIGEIQWMRANGFEATTNPILKPLNNIECRDAIINVDGTRADWPDANVVVGNPPFLGAKWMLDRLGEDYTTNLRRAFPISSSLDLVVYWFVQAASLLERSVTRIGFIATNMIRSPSNIEGASAAYALGSISEAWSDEPWIIDGADVRVSIIIISEQHNGSAKLDGRPVPRITFDLKALSFDIRDRRPLRANLKRAIRGFERGGAFDMDREQAVSLLSLPTNPNGQKNKDVVKPFWTVSDLVGRPKGKWIVDFDDKTESEAALYEAPYNFIAQTVKLGRASNREERTAKRWWKFRRSGEGVREVLNDTSAVIVTGLVTKYRLFRWMRQPAIPDTRVIVFKNSSWTLFGILSSKFHEQWSLNTCQFHGVGNDPVYTPGDCFETFPFPIGLTPDIPAAATGDPCAQAIAKAAVRLNELRENWMNPVDLVRREPEVVTGFPDRILPLDESAAEILKRRTLTKLYNARPAWLDHAHRDLDRAVASAYGWQDAFDSGALTDEEILKRLFGLNQERASQQEE